MSKFKFINLIDKIFVSAGVFLIVFAWINFYIRNLWATFWLSIFFSFAIVFLLYYFLGKKHEKEFASKQEMNEMNTYFLAFRLMGKTEQLNLLRQMIAKQANLTKNEILLNNKKLCYNDADGLHLIIVATHLTRIDDNELINLINENFNEKYDCYDIYCNEFIANKNLLKDKKINFFNRAKIYELFKTCDICPSNIDKLSPSASKFKFKDVIKSMFLPNRAKSYFLCGIILIFSSIILPNHLYYIIFGSMLLLFAIICKILPKVSN